MCNAANKDQRSSRRSRIALVTVLATTAFAAACGSPDPERIPGPALIEDFDLAVETEVVLTSNGFTPDELTLAEGEGFVVHNETEEPQRIRADDSEGEIAFDTGDLLPGEQTTIRVLVEDLLIFTVSDQTSDLTVTVLIDPDQPK